MPVQSIKPNLRIRDKIHLREYPEIEIPELEKSLNSKKTHK